MKKYLFDKYRHFLHGGDYNPEQWIDSKRIWDEDMRLMKLAGCNEASVGIFSWSTIEPREGVYDFSFLDEILDKIYAIGGRVLLATPSGARPHWMADAHPEVLRTLNDCRKQPFGTRQNHCFTSPYYRKKVYETDVLLSKRYGKHPAVLGWHISNEFGGECFCPLCRAAFRDFLRKKYGTIENLNAQWWTTFWSHTYDGFEQIDPPLKDGDSFTPLWLDWRRFVTVQTADFLKNEVAAVRTYSDKPTTTNFMTNYIWLNYNVLATEIDYISWDSYPTWHPSPAGKRDNADVAAETALCHDAYRALKQQPFVLMESTPSHTNWQECGKLKRPGMHKLASLQAVAHGSDAVLYFQWRKSRGSDEKFHGAVIDHVGHEHTRVFRDVAEVGQTLPKLEEILGTMPKVRVCLIMDVENDLALRSMQGFQQRDKKYYETCLAFYKELWNRGIDVDVTDAHRDLSGYALVIAPMLYMVSADTAEILRKYVSEGGTLISGYMLAYVNENDLCYLGGTPGAGLQDVFGVWSEEIDTLYPDESNEVLFRGKAYRVVDYCERLHLRDGAKALATYEKDFYAGEPAVIVHNYGKGTTYYIGTRDTGELKKDLLTEILHGLKITGNLPELPYGVTAHARYDGDIKYLFVENYNDREVTVDIGEHKYNMETGESECGFIALPPFGIKVYKEIG